MISNLDAVVGCGRPPAWWRVAPGVTWIQCHDPETAERIRKLKRARLVAYGVNVFLRTFEVPHPVAWVDRLMRKSQKPPPNRAFFSAAGPSCGSKPGEVSG
jgi:hypothetical protein